MIRIVALAPVISLVAVAQAQPAAPSASTVLANVQQFYAHANQLTAQFRQVVKNSAFGTTHSSDGKLWVAKPSKFRFEYLQRRGSVIAVAKDFIFDGSTLWFLDHANKQIYQQNAQTSMLPAAISFLTNASALSSHFNVSLDTSGAYGGQNATVLELVPKQPSAQYKRLFLVVDPVDWKILESIVIDSNGDTNAFTFFSPNTRSSISATWFAVNPTALPTYKVVAVNNTGPTRPTPTSGNSTP